MAHLECCRETETPVFAARTNLPVLDFQTWQVWSPPTSVIHDVLITTSSSVFLPTWPNHLSVTSLDFLIFPLNNNNDITSMALKSSEARAQKRNKTKSVIIFKSRGHTGIIISLPHMPLLLFLHF